MENADTVVGLVAAFGGAGSLLVMVAKKYLVAKATKSIVFGIVGGETFRIESLESSDLPKTVRAILDSEDKLKSTPRGTGD
jgi:hypothetical protein